MGTFKLEKPAAWVVLAECYGEPAVKGMRPSTLTEADLALVSDLLDRLILAYKGDNITAALVGFLPGASRPGALGTLLKAVKTGSAVRANPPSPAESSTSQPLTISGLPFHSGEFSRWMKGASQKRGLVLREFLTLLMADTPAGFDAAAARAETDRSIRHGTAGEGARLLKIPGF